MDTSLAEKYEKENDWNNALKEYKKLQELTPDNSGLSEKVGWCLSQLKLFDDAIDVYQYLSLKEPQKAKWDYMIGYQHYSKKEWKIANEWFRKSLQKFPNYFIVRYRLGYALTQCCGSILKLKSPEFLEAYKQFEECEVLWDSMSDTEKMREKSHFADVCFQKGKILIERKNWEFAVKSLKKAVDMYPDDLDYNYCYSKALLGEGRSKEALDIISKFSGKYYVDELKGTILYELGDYDKAIDLYLKILETRKKDYLYRDLANIYLTKKDIKAAFKYAQQAVNIGPNNHVNYLLLGKVYYEASLYISARDMLQKAILLKKEKYDAVYQEASDLLKSVIEIINQLNIQEDKIENKNDLLGDNVETKNGRIIKYNKDKGFGFIESDKMNYFFHISNVSMSQQSKIEENITVSFISQNTEKGIAAIKIEITK